MTRNFGSTTPAPITNYYIRSSVLNKVVSETDSTGKKLKTYIPAGGTTLAEQRMETVNNVTTEKLYFIHQDASGASAQQTKANGDPIYPNSRVAEYDPVGQNVADSGAYVNPITDPNAGNDSGIDLFGSGQGYRPNQMKFTSDGMPIPASWARQKIESGLVEGSFGLVRLQMAQYFVRDLIPNRPPRTEDPRYWDRLDNLRSAVDDSIWQVNLLSSWEPNASNAEETDGGGGESGAGNSTVVLSGNDCLAFARKAEALAKEYIDTGFPYVSDQVQKFMNDLATWGTELTAATSAAVAQRANPLGSRNSFTSHTDSGFKSIFKDPESNDQVRHAIGGLIAGYVNIIGNGNAGKFVMIMREVGSSDESWNADNALNAMTMPMGEKLAGEKGGNFAKELGKWIRDNLCNPPVKEGAGRR